MASYNMLYIFVQAFWKGFRLRKKLTSALAAVKTDVEEDYSEVNVDDFMFDEVSNLIFNIVIKGWNSILAYLEASPVGLSEAYF